MNDESFMCSSSSGYLQESRELSCEDFSEYLLLKQKANSAYFRAIWLKHEKGNWVKTIFSL